MPIVKLDCEKCGGTLTYDPELAAQHIFNCPFCGTPYLETQEINYNQYNTQIEHLHADVVQVNNDQNAQARLRAGNANLTLKRFNNALEDFKEASKLAPDNYLAWWGQIQAISHDFTVCFDRKSELDKLQKLFTYALQMAPEQEKPQLEKKFQSYINPLLNQNSQNITVTDNELKKLHEEKNRLEGELRFWQNQKHPKMAFPHGLFWFSIIIFPFCFVFGTSYLIGAIGAVLSGLALLWMIIGRPILNNIAQSKEDEKQRQIGALQQKLSNTHTRINELSQKHAHWIS